MRVTANEAKNRFGRLCAQAQREPVFVEKAGQIDTVILSAEQASALASAMDAVLSSLWFVRIPLAALAQRSRAHGLT
jgi:hypothetical protein